MVRAKARKPIQHIVRVFKGVEDVYDIPDGVTEALMQCLGMEYTQAKNCEYMIMNKGCYSVHHTNDLERAGLVLQSLQEEGLKCILLHK